MKYIAPLEYIDYDDAEFSFLTFEGTEEDLEKFVVRINNSCKWYKTEMLDTIAKIKLMYSSVNEDKFGGINNDALKNVIELDNYKKNLHFVKIDNTLVDLKFIFSDYSFGYNQDGKYYLPHFFTLKEFYDEQSKNCSMLDKTDIKEF